MLDEIGFTVFIGCVILYIVLFFFWKHNQKPCKMMVRERLFGKWVEERLKSERDLLVAVQSLRNIIMAISVFISAFLILLGIIIGFLQGPALMEPPFFFGIDGFSTLFVKLLADIIGIFLCVFFFIMAIRMAARTSLLLGSNPTDISCEGVSGLQYTKDTFKSAQNYWMFGIRGTFYLLALNSWFLNPIFFMLVSLIVTIFIIFKDLKL